MNLTPSERAAMVKDLESLAKEYDDPALTVVMIGGIDATVDAREFARGMSINYSALAAALKEGLTFRGVA